MRAKAPTPHGNDRVFFLKKGFRCDRGARKGKGVTKERTKRMRASFVFKALVTVQTLRITEGMRRGWQVCAALYFFFVVSSQNVKGGKKHSAVGEVGWVGDQTPTRGRSEFVFGGMLFAASLANSLTLPPLIGSSDIRDGADISRLRDCQFFNSTWTEDGESKRRLDTSSLHRRPPSPSIHPSNGRRSPMHPLALRDLSPFHRPTGEREGRKMQEKFGEAQVSPPPVGGSGRRRLRGYA
jgi:hypothetical protein